MKYLADRDLGDEPIYNLLVISHEFRCVYLKGLSKLFSFLLKQIDIIGEVKSFRGTPFRPPVEEVDIPDYIVKCIKACWHEEPEVRPDIRYVQVLLKDMQVDKLYHTVFEQKHDHKFE